MSWELNAGCGIGKWFWFFVQVSDQCCLSVFSPLFLRTWLHLRFLLSSKAIEDLLEGCLAQGILSDAQLLTVVLGGTSKHRRSDTSRTEAWAEDRWVHANVGGIRTPREISSTSPSFSTARFLLSSEMVTIRKWCLARLMSHALACRVGPSGRSVKIFQG